MPTPPTKPPEWHARAIRFTSYLRFVVGLAMIALGIVWLATRPNLPLDWGGPLWTGMVAILFGVAFVYIAVRYKR